MNPNSTNNTNKNNTTIKTTKIPTMDTKEVINLLRISKSTLYNLIKEGKLAVRKLSNGHYEYEQDTIYQYLLKTTTKKHRKKNYFNKKIKVQNPNFANQIVGNRAIGQHNLQKLIQQACKKKVIKNNIKETT